MLVPTPQSLETLQQRFLSLFPHRYDYIWAKHPEPGQRPQWQTESRHPLTDRLIQQGRYLYGVRFGKQTNYLMLDIDADSPYHPSHDPLAIPKLVSHLEPLGLVSYVAVTSSYSGGLHLYFPFQESQNSYKLAAATAALVENGGFVIAQGKLEVFPDLKAYVEERPPSLFNGHRLPLQNPGSYLLDRDWHPVSGQHHLFVQHWQFAAGRNQVSDRQVEQARKLKPIRVKRLSASADKFRSDLDAEIETGWTGDGQTNHLLGRIALREYIFHHVLHNTEPLTGKLLAQQIESIATHLPGYTEFCDHRHEIRQRSEEWARSVEASKYYPYRRGGKKREPQKSLTTREKRNQERKEGALQRIQRGVMELHQRGELPIGATARREALAKNYRVSQGTLDKNKSLWHPKHLDQASIASAGDIKVGKRLISEGVQGIDQASAPNKFGCSGWADRPQAGSAQPSFNETGGSGGFSTGWRGVEERERQRRELGQIRYAFDLEKEQEREKIQKALAYLAGEEHLERTIALEFVETLEQGETQISPAKSAGETIAEEAEVLEESIDSTPIAIDIDMEDSIAPVASKSGEVFSSGLEVMAGMVGTDRRAERAPDELVPLVLESPIEVARQYTTQIRRDVMLPLQQRRQNLQGIGVSQSKNGDGLTADQGIEPLSAEEREKRQQGIERVKQGLKSGRWKVENQEVVWVEEKPKSIEAMAETVQCIQQVRQQFIQPLERGNEARKRLPKVEVNGMGFAVGRLEGYTTPNLEEWLKSGDPILEREARSRMGWVY